MKCNCDCCCYSYSEAINETRSYNHSIDEVMNKIRIRTCRENEFVVLTISDTGIGIPKSMQDKIFEPFFTTKEVGKGMGLGLSIVYGIVQSYGGSVQVESEEGRGTCFKYSFPCTFS